MTQETNKPTGLLKAAVSRRDLLKGGLIEIGRAHV